MGDVVIADISLRIEEAAMHQLLGALETIHPRPPFAAKEIKTRRLSLAHLGTVQADFVSEAQARLEGLIPSLPEPVFAFTGFGVRTIGDSLYLVAQASPRDGTREDWTVFIRSLRAAMHRRLGPSQAPPAAGTDDLGDAEKAEPAQDVKRRHRDVAYAIQPATIPSEEPLAAGTDDRGWEPEVILGKIESPDTWRSWEHPLAHPIRSRSPQVAIYVKSGLEANPQIYVP